MTRFSSIPTWRIVLLCAVLVVMPARAANAQTGVIEGVVGSAQNQGSVGGTIEGRRLMRVRAVAQVFHFRVGPAEDIDSIGKLTEVLATVHFFQIVHGAISRCN